MVKKEKEQRRLLETKSKREGNKMGFLAEKGIKAICFDIDGTLYPKRETNIYLLKAAIKHPIFSWRYNKMRVQIRKEDGLKAIPATTLSAFRERECKIMFGKPKKEYQEKYLSYLYEPWCYYDQKIKRFEGLLEFLDKVKSEDYKIGFLSDFPIGNKVDVLGLTIYPSFVASSEDYGTLKPNATPFIKMAEEMHLKPSEILYVGDSYSKDVTGSKNAGMNSVMITKKNGSYPLADIVVKDYFELLERLF